VGAASRRDRPRSTPVAARRRSHQWRSRMAAEGLEPLSEKEIDALRDKTPGPDFSWDD